ncbi:uncharacterized protein METZ01_LOCUS206560, partial [marine metagenome]
MSYTSRAGLTLVAVAAAVLGAQETMAQYQLVDGWPELPRGATGWGQTI